MPVMGLHAQEIVILTLYLIVTFGLAITFARRGAGEAGASEYFLAGRSLPWYLIGLSFYASNMSGASFVGLIGASYSHGLAIFHYEWTAALVLVLFALVILPVFLRGRLFTVPEYLERRYDRRTRTTYAMFTLVALLFIDMAGALYAGAVVLVTGLPFLDLWTACILISILTGLYTIFGGLRTVVITDAFQAVVVVAGAAFVTAYGLAAVGGWAALPARLDAQHLTLFRPADDANLPWPGIAGVVILGLYYWTFNQYFVQRALAARSLADGRHGALFAGLLKLFNLFLMIVPGLVAAALYPALASPDQAFPTLVFELLPAGIRGIVLAAMLAAIMSSLDSALNAASSLVTMDLARQVRPTLDDRALFRLGRIVTAGFMVVAALYAPLISQFGSLFTYFQSTLAYLVPPFVAIYLAGILSRKFSRNCAFWTLIVIEPLALAMFFAQEVTGVWTAAGLPRVHFTYVAMALFAISIVLMAVISLATSLRDREPVDEAAVFAVRDWRPIVQGNQKRPLVDYRVLAALLMIATALMLLALA